MKKPTGVLREELSSHVSFCIQDGNVVRDDPWGGVHYQETGLYWFEYMDGKSTRKYSYKTAPKWLKALIDSATGAISTKGDTE